jgi:hypothetical protein
VRWVVLAALVVSTSVAHAERQFWNSVFVHVRDRERGPAAWLDVQARRRSDGMLYLVRPGLGYAFTPELVVHAGYGWFAVDPDEGPWRHEQRLWQQVLYTRLLGESVRAQLRGRLEQRFGRGDDLGHRIRLFARAQWTPDPTPRIHLVVWDELFWAVNATDWAGPAGYDQNRGFAGLGIDTSLRGVRVEAGYLNVVRRRDWQVDHAVMVNVFATLLR